MSAKRSIALLSVGVTIAATLTIGPAEQASAGVLLGSPNRCTHSKSTGYGLLGYTIAQYNSGTWVGSTHRHTVRMTYVTYAVTKTSGNQVTQETITRSCSS
jgi:hypothetical protein